MSWNDVKQAFKVEGLKPGEKYVLISIADYRNQETKLCCPGSKSISKKTGYSTRQVKRHIKALGENGVLLVEKKEGQNGFKSNHYKFSWDKKIGKNSKKPFKYSRKSRREPRIVTIEELR